MKKDKILKLFVRLIFLVIMACAVVFGNVKYNRYYQKKSRGKKLKGNRISECSVKLWYCDESLKSYLKHVKRAYESNHNVKISLDYVDKAEIFDKINDGNKKADGNTPDIYLFPAEKLETAYLGGMSKDVEIAEDDMQKLGEGAISAGTFDGELRAYPLLFEEPVFVTNKAYCSNEMKTFDDILAYAKEFDGQNYPAVTDILKWDVKELQYNYAFVGQYLNYGGQFGDNADEIDVSNQSVINSLKYYNSLNAYFSTDINTVNYDSIVNDFNAGKIVFSMINTRDLDRIKDVDYEVTRIPDMNMALKTRTLAFTTLLSVNPYGKSVLDDNSSKYVDEFVKYLVFDNADYVDKYSEYIPCCKCMDIDGANAIYDQYDASTGLPKFEYASGFYVQLEIAMGKVWEGKDINETVKEFENSIQ